MYRLIYDNFINRHYFSSTMKATIVNYRIGRHHQKPRHMVIHIQDIDDKEKAEKLIGKEVVWTTPAKKEIKGKIKSTHGNKGNVRAVFEKGMPGQSLGTKVEIK